MYEISVQDAVGETSQLASIYREQRKKEARSFREDFCGTFANSCQWIRRHRENKAVAVDYDPAPLEYGFQNHFNSLNAHQQKRLSVIQKNVFRLQKPKVDLLAALNFSYLIFKEEVSLLRYFKSCYRSLNSNGVLVLDLMGGGECLEANVEQEKHTTKEKRSFTYVWDQISYDIISHQAEFYIHFKFPNGRQMKKAFHYHWRLWTIPEVRALLAKAGFKKSVVYCEGTARGGDGNGIFKMRQKEEGCAVWIVYIVGIK